MVFHHEMQAVRDVTGELMPLSPSHSAAATEAALSAVAAGVQWEKVLQETQLWRNQQMDEYVDSKHVPAEM